MKGVILAGGTGTRLKPLTNITNKHLLPVYNKPMILYPLQTLLDGGVTDILIITGGEYLGDFIDLLGSGSKFGCKFTYKVQDEAGGIAQALLLAEDFVDGNFVCILGDNIFEDKLTFDVPKLFLKNSVEANRFGVLINDIIIEKPKDIKEGAVVTGCYVYPIEVFDEIKNLKPSQRGELEISDLNNYFISSLSKEFIGGFWSDAGTFDSLLSSANFIKEQTCKSKQ